MLEIPEHSYEAGGWATEGEKTDPVINTILADTGALPAGLYDFHIMHNTNSDDPRYALIEHRNAANTSTIKSHVYIPYMANNLPLTVFPTYKMLLNERLRIICSEAFTHRHQASILWVRRYS